MALDTADEKEEEAREAKEEMPTEKDLEVDEEPDGEVAVEDPEGDESLEIDEGPQMPHGAHVLNDMHDFYGAGHGVGSEHLKLLDNDRVKGLCEDHLAQLEAMAGELRDLFAQEYPEHAEHTPEAFGEGDMEEESETPGEEFLEENEDETIDPADEHEEEKDMDEEELDEKSQTSKSQTAKSVTEDDGATEKSLTPAVSRAIIRKYERAVELRDAEIADLEAQIADLQSAVGSR